MKKEEGSVTSKSQTGVQKNKRNEQKKNFWLPHEDALVLELMKVNGEKWTKIASSLQNRTGKQVRDRYLNYLRPTVQQTTWTDEEDELLRQLAIDCEKRWTIIASKLNGRTENQVKNRYHLLLRKQNKEKQQSKKQTESKGFKQADSDFRLKSESTLTFESKTSSEELWDFTLQPLELNPEIKVENFNVQKCYPGYLERKKFNNHFFQCK